MSRLRYKKACVPFIYAHFRFKFISSSITISPSTENDPHSLVMRRLWLTPCDADTCIVRVQTRRRHARGQDICNTRAFYIRTYVCVCRCAIMLGSFSFPGISATVTYVSGFPVSRGITSTPRSVQMQGYVYVYV